MDGEDLVRLSGCLFVSRRRSYGKMCLLRRQVMSSRCVEMLTTAFQWPFCSTFSYISWPMLLVALAGMARCQRGDQCFALGWFQARSSCLAPWYNHRRDANKMTIGKGPCSHSHLHLTGEPLRMQFFVETHVIMIFCTIPPTFRRSACQVLNQDYFGSGCSS